MKMKYIMLITCFVLLPSLVIGGELTEISGYCGKEEKNIKWIVNTEDKTLVFEGSGEMQDFQYDNQPWKQYNDKINSVTINEGILNVGDYAFREMKFSNVDLPSSIETIGNYSFAQCENLKTIILSDNISGIGQYAFYYSGLESIKIPASIQYLEDGLFQSCIDLKSIILPEGIISIGCSTFKWCQSLSNILLPNTIETIKSSAFEDCSILETINLPEGLTVIGSNAFGNTIIKEIVLPSSITELNNSAFENCPKLNTIKLHDNLEIIRKSCFRNCISLKQIVIPKGCYSVGDYAFSNCTGLEQVIVENNTRFGDYVFNGCSSLISVDLPDDFDDNWFGINVFQDCQALKTIFNSTTLFYMSKDCDETYTIPSGIAKIGKYAFYGNKKIKNLILPSTINCLGAYSLALTDIEELDFSTLENVDIYEGALSGSAIKTIKSQKKITSCGSYSFSSCQNLTELDLSNINGGIGNGTFRYCKNLIKLLIPNSVGDRRVSIGKEAFFYCEKLKEIDFTSIGDIGNGAFAYCNSLKEVKISDFGYNYSGSSIGHESFKGCSNLEKFIIGSSGINHFWLSAFEGCDNLKTIVFESKSIPNIIDLNSLSYNGLWGKSFLEYNLPYDNTEFKMYGYLADKFLGQDYSFWSRVKIEKVYEDLSGECGDMGDNIKWSLNTKEGVLRIVGSGNMKMPEDEKALTWKDRNLAINEIEFSDDIESICPYAFNSTSVQIIKFNRKLKKIGKWAFSYCNSLNKVILNDGLTEIEDCVFQSCENLEEIAFPNSLTTLGQAIIARCYNLKSVTFPKRISFIPDYTFVDCWDLKDIYLPAYNTPGMGKYNLDRISSDKITIHIPQGTVEKYQESPGWSLCIKDEYYEYVNINSNEGGLFTVNNNTIKTGVWNDYLVKGEMLSVKVVPNDYYTVNSILINGKQSISDLKDNTLIFNALNKSMDIKIEFKANEYNLSVINHGSGIIHIWGYDIDDKAKFKISYPEKTDISFVPNKDCSLESLLINGIESKDKLVNNVYHIEKTVEEIIIETYFISHVLGDASGDGIVNDTDIGMVRDCIMGNPSENFSFKNADTNSDGSVNVVDLVRIVNMIEK